MRMKPNFLAGVSFLIGSFATSTLISVAVHPTATAAMAPWTESLETSFTNSLEQLLGSTNLAPQPPTSHEPLTALVSTDLRSESVEACLALTQLACADSALERVDVSALTLVEQLVSTAPMAPEPLACQDWIAAEMIASERNDCEFTEQQLWTTEPETPLRNHEDNEALALFLARIESVMEPYGPQTCERPVAEPPFELPGFMIVHAGF